MCWFSTYRPDYEFSLITRKDKTINLESSNTALRFKHHIFYTYEKGSNSKRESGLNCIWEALSTCTANQETSPICEAWLFLALDFYQNKGIKPCEISFVIHTIYEWQHSLRTVTVVSGQLLIMVNTFPINKHLGSLITPSAP